MCMAAGSSLVALGAIPAAGRFQIVDRVEIDIRAIADGGVEIARHGQIENQQRPLDPWASTLANCPA